MKSETLYFSNYQDAFIFISGLVCNSYTLTWNKDNKLQRKFILKYSMED